MAQSKIRLTDEQKANFEHPRSEDDVQSALGSNRASINYGLLELIGDVRGERSAIEHNGEWWDAPRPR